MKFLSKLNEWHFIAALAVIGTAALLACALITIHFIWERVGWQP